MNKNKLIYILQFILIIILILNTFLFKITNLYEIAGIILIFLVLFIYAIGFKKDNFRYKKDIFLNILIILLIYYFTTYFLGIFFGFVKTSYSLSIINIIKNIFPVILLIILSELLRYVIFNRSKNTIFYIIINFIIFLLIDINANSSIYNFTSIADIVKLTCQVIFPSITKNIFLIYLTAKVGFKIPILYRLLMELNIYLIPISPDFGEYINILIKTLIPILIMVKINNLYNYNNIRKVKNIRKDAKKSKIIYTVISILLLIIISLNSGLFKYQSLTIGSGSMTPKIRKGDIVVLRKYKINELNRINKGDILVYKHDNKIIVHRVVKIYNEEENFSFRTKGDNNKVKDSWIVEGKEIVGIVKFKISFLGYPTVKLNELMRR